MKVYHACIKAQPESFCHLSLIGKGNLACLSFAGGRPISKRQLRFYPEDNGIRDVINFRSFYNNLRVAATLGTFYKKRMFFQLSRPYIR